MQVSIHDREALLAISPAALSAHARSAGWSRHDSYRKHSDIHVGDTLPEIIVPRTQRLGDYASVVASLIEIFAQVSEQDQLTVYRSLLTADRDVIRIRATENDEGSLGLNAGVNLVQGARDMVLAAACSLGEPRPVYRAGANREAADLTESMRLGQTEPGSFVVTVLTPVVPPPVPRLFEESDDPDAPHARRVTRRLVAALTAVHEAVERAHSGDGGAFEQGVAHGVSANLCEALARIIEPFPALDIGVSWAQTRPMDMSGTVRFGKADAALLREAARAFGARAPKPDRQLFGYVRVLDRAESDLAGTIRLRAPIDGQLRSVVVDLDQADYEQAVQAHRDQAPVVLRGDLDHVGQRWRLRNPRLEAIVRDDGQDSDDP